jgi:hypothetical protein
MTTPLTNRLRAIVAPRLPSAPVEYDAQQQEQLLNTLRLYFNQLGNAVSTLLGPIGGRFLSTPYGAFQRNADLLFAAANTAYIVPLDTTDMASGMYFLPGDGIHVEQAGVYNYQYSVQFANTDSQTHTAFLWFRVNGVDVPGTASKFDIPSKHGASDGYLIAACNFYVELKATDYVELWGAADAVEGASTDGVYFEAYPAQTTPFPRPTIPAVVATLTFVSSSGA